MISAGDIVIRKDACMKLVDQSLEISDVTEEGAVSPFTTWRLYGLLLTRSTPCQFKVRHLSRQDYLQT